MQLNKQHYKLLEAANILGVTLDELIYCLSTSNHPAYIYYADTGSWFWFKNNSAIQLSAPIYTEGFLRIPQGDFHIAAYGREHPDLYVLLLDKIEGHPTVYLKSPNNEVVEVASSAIVFFESFDKEYLYLSLPKPIPLPLEKVVLFQLPEIISASKKHTKASDEFESSFQPDNECAEPKPIAELHSDIRANLHKQLTELKDKYRDKKINKAKVNGLALTAVIDAIRKIEPTFNPMMAPKPANGFFNLCKMLPSNIFSMSDSYFRKCCRGQGADPKKVYICWRGQTDENFWKQLISSLASK